MTESIVTAILFCILMFSMGMLCKAHEDRVAKNGGASFKVFEGRTYEIKQGSF